MNRLSIFFKFLFVGLIAATIAACDNNDDVTPADLQQTIAEIAAADAQFSTLVAALDRVNLVPVLDGVGNFTVFAPTNAAFQALGVDLNSLTDEGLIEILLNHVIGVEIYANDIATGQTYVPSLAATGPADANLSLLVEKDANGVKINGNATVASADIDASNGVIHVVDQVIMPLDVVGHALANNNFTSLVGALGVADGDLVTVLGSEGPFTVFAPVNAAFDAIADVTATLNTEQLSKVLTYHVLSGNVVSSDLSDAMNVATVNGEKITINLTSDSAVITDAQGGSSNIVLTDVQAKNGVIHVLDKVILPENL